MRGMRTGCEDVLGVQNGGKRPLDQRLGGRKSTSGEWTQEAARMKEDTQGLRANRKWTGELDKGGEGRKLQGQADLLDWSALSMLAGGWGRS